MRRLSITGQPVRYVSLICISKDGTLGNILYIGGLNIGLPAKPKKIRFEEKTNDLQKWRRYEVPKELVHFDKIFKDEPNQESKLKEVRNRHAKFIDGKKFGIHIPTSIIFVNYGE